MQPIRQSALIRHPAPSMLMQPAQQRQTTDTIVFSTQAAGSTQNSYSNSQLNGRQWCGAAFSSASNNARTSGPTVLKPPTLHSSTKQHSHSRPNQPSNASTGSGEPIRPAIQPDSRFSQPGIGTDKSHGRTSHPFQSPRPSYPVKLASPAVSFQLAKPTTSSQLPCFSRVAPATRPTSHLTPVALSRPLRLGCLFWPRRPSQPAKPTKTSHHAQSERPV